MKRCLNNACETRIYLVEGILVDTSNLAEILATQVEDFNSSRSY